MSHASSFGVEAAVFERAAAMFALLGTPTRLRLISQLCDREMNVGELIAALGGAQPSVSQNLNLLFRAGVLSRQRKGPQVYYRVNPQHSLMLCDAVRTLLREPAAGARERAASPSLERRPWTA